MVHASILLLLILSQLTPAVPYDERCEGHAGVCIYLREPEWRCPKGTVLLTWESEHWCRKVYEAK